ncbi:nitroreductase family deazaflavin-dependent oxidoreductase [Streptomyces gardneri]|uniref:nitroreductase/quinone reductase family protein n=1 Tax=Streptomyces gardneri TaxID=66892 RepID=UPI0006BD92B6|nr:nitroreductase/quinone reductase family protein [Streptomyces gardneri]QPK43822.1 nitroreductase family deazaflavin-dependent oxidoreductase [Streptomyces gardneri]WRK35078.1 nitroreductase/quinone reductase family protein [Streptomyces venezuelae]CUM43365.1 AclJ [Streptomyces venezuelae]
MPDFNQQVIEEFRANGGRVGGMFEGAALLLLTTTGARSGRPHTNPAVYVRDGARLLVFASNAGGPRHPAWFHNLSADPHVTVELGTPAGTVERFVATAVVTEGEERDRLYAEQAARDPGFAAYQAGTERIIPVVALHRLDLGDPERHRAIADHLVKVHAELRAELTALREGLGSAVTAAGTEAETEAEGPVVPDTPALGRRLARHCLTFCGALHAHHHNEDSVFDLLEREFPELSDALDRMREQHKLVARTVEDLEALLSSGAAPEVLRPEVDRLASRLEEHFAYEEARLLPALAPE